MSERVLAPNLTTGTTGEFATELVNYLNYLRDNQNDAFNEAALTRLFSQGVGRASGAVLSVASGVARLSNGIAYAGPGTDDTNDAAYFRGARVQEIAADDGFVELTGDDAPPADKAAGTFGYLDWYGSVVWFDEKQSPCPGNRWCIGQVTTDVAGAVLTVDPDQADTILSLSAIADEIAAIKTRLDEIEAGGGEGGGALYEKDQLWTPEDPRGSVAVIEEKFAEARAYTDTQVATGGVKIQSQPTDELFQRVGILEGEQAKDNTDSAQRFPDIIVNIGSTGDGSGGSENFLLPEGTVAINESEREFQTT